MEYAIGKSTSEGERDGVGREVGIEIWKRDGGEDKERRVERILLGSARVVATTDGGDGSKRPPREGDMVRVGR